MEEAPTFESTHRQRCDTLPKLIDRLKDPQGESELELRSYELLDLAAYQGIDDFAEVFSEFLIATKACTRVTILSLHGPHKKLWAAFPIINTLCKHLPNAVLADVDVSDEEGVLAKEIQHFERVRITFSRRYEVEETEDLPVLQLNPDLRGFGLHNRFLLPSNVHVGPVLLALPFPSKLCILSLEGGVDLEGDPDEWNENLRLPFSVSQLDRLVSTMQVSSLLRVTLKGLWFSTDQQCRQLARGLEGSSVQELSLLLFTPVAQNYSSVVTALAGMPRLEGLVARLYLDSGEHDDTTKGAYSIPLGSIVSGSPLLKWLGVGQGWKRWSSVQCEAFAAALKAPSCRLKSIDISQPYRDDELSPSVALQDLGTIMSSFSAPGSSIEIMKMSTICPWDKEEVEPFLSKLPRTTALQKVIAFDATYNETRFTESQGRRLVEILSGWYYLTDFRPTFWLNEDCYAQLLTLLRLNMAGRHYLTSPSRSHADGVEVLAQVRHELNDIFTHLLENPNLCDRGAFPDASKPVPSPKKDYRRRRRRRNRRKKRPGADENSDGV